MVERHQVAQAVARRLGSGSQNKLTIEGRKDDQGDHQYLYQGISGRPFRRQFSLADYVQVKGGTFKNGLLRIDLVRELPEAMKPRRIAIKSGNAAESQQVECKNTA
jgi:molecular chaperone IbpA